MRKFLLFKEWDKKENKILPFRTEGYLKTYLLNLDIMYYFNKQLEPTIGLPSIQINWPPFSRASCSFPSVFSFVTVPSTVALSVWSLHTFLLFLVHCFIQFILNLNLIFSCPLLYIEVLFFLLACSHLCWFLLYVSLLTLL